MIVEFELVDDVAIVTLNRPQALNALSFAIIEQIDQVLDQVCDSSARAVIIRGAGERAFCAGADIKELRHRQQSSQYAATRRGQWVIDRFAHLPMPSTALIHGYAFGGGLEIALACNFRLATERAKLGLPEIKLGLTPGYGGTQRLPRIIGEARALEMILTGRTVDAHEAERIGLVNRLVTGDGLTDAINFVHEFSCYSQPVLRLSRAAVQRACAVAIDEGLRVEADLNTLAFQTNDAEEGMAAFSEKRSAQFTDQ